MEDKEVHQVRYPLHGPLTIGIVCVAALGCDKAMSMVGPSTPTKCAACSGTGKVTESFNAPIKAELSTCTGRELKEGGGFFSSPKYVGSETVIGVRNLSDQGGEFKVIGHYIYDGIGDHTESASIFVPAHGEASGTVVYRIDKSPDKIRCEIQAPSVVQSIDKVCPVCGGRGLVNP